MAEKMHVIFFVVALALFTASAFSACDSELNLSFESESTTFFLHSVNLSDDCVGKQVYVWQSSSLEQCFNSDSKPLEFEEGTVFHVKKTGFSLEEGSVEAIRERDSFKISFEGSIDEVWEQANKTSNGRINMCVWIDSDGDSFFSGEEAFGSQTLSSGDYSKATEEKKEESEIKKEEPPKEEPKEEKSAQSVPENQEPEQPVPEKKTSTAEPEKYPAEQITPVNCESIFYSECRTLECVLARLDLKSICYLFGKENLKIKVAKTPEGYEEVGFEKIKITKYSVETEDQKAKIGWETNREAHCELWVMYKDYYVKELEEKNSLSEHSFTLSNLSPRTFLYRIECFDGEERDVEAGHFLIKEKEKPASSGIITSSGTPDSPGATQEQAGQEPQPTQPSQPTTPAQPEQPSKPETPEPPSPSSPETHPASSSSTANFKLVIVRLWQEGEQKTDSKLQALNSSIKGNLEGLYLYTPFGQCRNDLDVVEAIDCVGKNTGNLGAMTQQEPAIIDCIDSKLKGFLSSNSQSYGSIIVFLSPSFGITDTAIASQSFSISQAGVSQKSGLIFVGHCTVKFFADRPFWALSHELGHMIADFCDYDSRQSYDRGRDIRECTNYWPQDGLEKNVFDEVMGPYSGGGSCVSSKVNPKACAQGCCGPVLGKRGGVKLTSIMGYGGANIFPYEFTPNEWNVFVDRLQKMGICMEAKKR